MNAIEVGYLLGWCKERVEKASLGTVDIVARLLTELLDDAGMTAEADVLYEHYQFVCGADEEEGGEKA